ncbi:hypothetical protein [Winogradskyella ludwigii]|uniref:hypothetical protein n=1 Tax=Winogradskyella ludwigii TaxID=2686076 RepID=UPI0015C7A340|nr:hypothetical protein [Winogradskyella ludwigii]
MEFLTNKNLTITYLLLCLLVFTTSCSESAEYDIVGVWGLTTRTADIPFDVNEDGVFNTNLIQEINCNTLETLTFESNGTVFSGNEFSTSVTYFKDEVTNTYWIDVDCDKDGIISFASEYNVIEDNKIKISQRNYTLNSDTLTTVYENAVKIYNSDLTEIIETKNLTLIYTKQ